MVSELCAAVSLQLERNFPVQGAGLGLQDARIRGKTETSGDGGGYSSAAEP